MGRAKGGLVNGIVTGLLNRFLAQFLNIESLQFSFGGEISAENVAVKTEALAGIHRGLVVQKGLVGKLHVNFKWNLHKDIPLLVELEDVVILATFRDQIELTPELVREQIESEFQRRALRLDAMEQGQLAARLTALKEAGGSKSPVKKHRLRDFLAGLVRNTVFVLRNVHVRVENTGFEQFAGGLLLDVMTLHPSDSEWNLRDFGAKTHANPTDEFGRLFKIAGLDNFRCYFDSCFTSLGQCSQLPDAAQFTAAMRELAATDVMRRFIVDLGQFQTRIRATPGLTPATKNDRVAPALDVEVVLPECSVDISTEQLKLLMDRIQFLSTFGNYENVLQYRPKVRPRDVDRSAPGGEAEYRAVCRQWFRYAGLSVVSHIRSERDKRAFAQGGEFAQHLVRYVKDDYLRLYLGHLRCPGYEFSEETEELLEALERGMTLQRIIYLRALAMKRYDCVLAANPRLAKAALKAPYDASAEKELQSLMRGGVTEPPEPSGEEPPHELLQGGYLAQGRHPFMTMSVILGVVTVRVGIPDPELVQGPPSPGPSPLPEFSVLGGPLHSSPSVRLVLAQGAFSLARDTGGALISDASIGLLEIRKLQRDGAVDTHYPTILQLFRERSSDSEPEHAESFRQLCTQMRQLRVRDEARAYLQREGPGPLFTMHIEAPARERQDISVVLHIKLQPLRIVLPPTVYRGVTAAFMDVFTTSHTHKYRHQGHGAFRSMLMRHGRLRSGFAMSRLTTLLRNHKAFDFSIELTAPTVLIPEKDADTSAPCTMVDFGRLYLTSHFAPSDLNLPGYESDEVKARLFEHFELGFADIRIVCGDSYDNCMRYILRPLEWRPQAGEEVLAPFKARFVFSLSRDPSDFEVPLCLLTSDIDILRLRFSLVSFNRVLTATRALILSGEPSPPDPEGEAVLAARKPPHVLQALAVDDGIGPASIGQRVGDIFAELVRKATDTSQLSHKQIATYLLGRADVRFAGFDIQMLDHNEYGVSERPLFQLSFRQMHVSGDVRPFSRTLDVTASDFRVTAPQISGVASYLLTSLGIDGADPVLSRLNHEQREGQGSSVEFGLVNMDQRHPEFSGVFLAAKLKLGGFHLVVAPRVTSSFLRTLFQYWDLIQRMTERSKTPYRETADPRGEEELIVGDLMRSSLEVDRPLSHKESTNERVSRYMHGQSHLAVLDMAAKAPQPESVISSEYLLSIDFQSLRVTLLKEMTTTPSSSIAISAVPFVQAELQRCTGVICVDHGMRLISASLGNMEAHNIRQKGERADILSGQNRDQPLLSGGVLFCTPDSARWQGWATDMWVDMGGSLRLTLYSELAAELYTFAQRIIPSLRRGQQLMDESVMREQSAALRVQRRTDTATMRPHSDHLHRVRFRIRCPEIAVPLSAQSTDYTLISLGQIDLQTTVGTVGDTESGDETRMVPVHIVQLSVKDITVSTPTLHRLADPALRAATQRVFHFTSLTGTLQVALEHFFEGNGAVLEQTPFAKLDVTLPAVTMRLSTLQFDLLRDTIQRNVAVFRIIDSDIQEAARPDTRPFLARFQQSFFHIMEAVAGLLQPVDTTSERARSYGCVSPGRSRFSVGVRGGSLTVQLVGRRSPTFSPLTDDVPLPLASLILSDIDAFVRVLFDGSMRAALAMESALFTDDRPESGLSSRFCRILYANQVPIDSLLQAPITPLDSATLTPSSPITVPPVNTSQLSKLVGSHGACFRCSVAYKQTAPHLDVFVDFRHGKITLNMDTLCSCMDFFLSAPRDGALPEFTRETQRLLQQSHALADHIDVADYYALPSHPRVDRVAQHGTPPVVARSFLEQLQFRCELSLRAMSLALVDTSMDPVAECSLRFNSRLLLLSDHQSMDADFVLDNVTVSQAAYTQTGQLLRSQYVLHRTALSFSVNIYLPGPSGHVLIPTSSSQQLVSRIAQSLTQDLSHGAMFDPERPAWVPETATQRGCPVVLVQANSTHSIVTHISTRTCQLIMRFINDFRAKRDQFTTADVEQSPQPEHTLDALSPDVPVLISDVIPASDAHREQEQSLKVPEMLLFASAQFSTAGTRDCLEIVFVDGSRTPDVPLLSFNVHACSLTAALQSGRGAARGELNYNVRLYNPHSSSWDPLIEPTQVMCAVTHSATASETVPATAFDISMPYALRVVLSSAVPLVLGQFVEVFSTTDLDALRSPPQQLWPPPVGADCECDEDCVESEGQEASVAQLSDQVSTESIAHPPADGTKHLFLVRNATGLPLYVTPRVRALSQGDDTFSLLMTPSGTLSELESDGRSLPGGTESLLPNEYVFPDDPFGSSSVDFDSLSVTENMAGCQDHHELYLRVPGYAARESVCVDRTGSVLLQLVADATEAEAEGCLTLRVTVSLENRQHMITVSGLYGIQNDTDLTLCVLFSDPGRAGIPDYPVTAAPGATAYLPALMTAAPMFSVCPVCCGVEASEPKRIGLFLPNREDDPRYHWEEPSGAQRERQRKRSLLRYDAKSREGDLRSNYERQLDSSHVLRPHRADVSDCRFLSCSDHRDPQRTCYLAVDVDTELVLGQGIVPPVVNPELLHATAATYVIRPPVRVVNVFPAPLEATITDSSGSSSFTVATNGTKAVYSVLPLSKQTISLLPDLSLTSATTCHPVPALISRGKDSAGSPHRLPGFFCVDCDLHKDGKEGRHRVFFGLSVAVTAGAAREVTAYPPYVVLNQVDYALQARLGGKAPPFTCDPSCYTVMGLSHKPKTKERKEADSAGPGVDRICYRGGRSIAFKKKEKMEIRRLMTTAWSSAFSPATIGLGGEVVLHLKPSGPSCDCDVDSLLRVSYSVSVKAGCTRLVTLRRRIVVLNLTARELATEIGTLDPREIKYADLLSNGRLPIELTDANATYLPASQRFAFVTIPSGGESKEYITRAFSGSEQQQPQSLYLSGQHNVRCSVPYGSSWSAGIPLDEPGQYVLQVPVDEMQHCDTVGTYQDNSDDSYDAGFDVDGLGELCPRDNYFVCVAITLVDGQIIVQLSDVDSARPGSAGPEVTQMPYLVSNETSMPLCFAQAYPNTATPTPPTQVATLHILLPHQCVAFCLTEPAFPLKYVHFSFQIQHAGGRDCVVSPLDYGSQYVLTGLVDVTSMRRQNPLSRMGPYGPVSVAVVIEPLGGTRHIRLVEIKGLATEAYRSDSESISERRALSYRRNNQTNIHALSHRRRTAVNMDEVAARHVQDRLATCQMFGIRTRAEPFLWRLRVSVSEFDISVINAVPREIFNLVAIDSCVELARTDQRYDLDARLMALQVDNTDPRALYPALLTIVNQSAGTQNCHQIIQSRYQEQLALDPKARPRRRATLRPRGSSVPTSPRSQTTSIAMSATEPGREEQLVQVTQRKRPAPAPVMRLKATLCLDHTDMLHLEQLQFGSQEISVLLDSQAIMNAADFFSAFRMPRRRRDPSVPKHRVFIETFQLNPLVFRVSIDITELISSSNAVRGIVGEFIGVGALVAQVDGAIIKFPLMKKDDVFMDSGEFVSRIIQFYKTRALTQFYRLAGSLSFFGSPLTLITSIGSGFSQAFQDPFESIQGMDSMSSVGQNFRRATGRIIRTTVYGVSSSLSGIFGSFATTFSSIVGDKRFNRRRSMRHRMAREGILNTGVAIVGSVFDGAISTVTGLYTMPYDGFHESVPRGFIAILRALIGLPLKPISGSFDAVSLLFEGIRSATNVQPTPPAVRVCRGFRPTGEVVDIDAQRADLHVPGNLTPEQLLAMAERQ